MRRLLLFAVPAFAALGAVPAAAAAAAQDCLPGSAVSAGTVSAAAGPLARSLPATGPGALVWLALVVLLFALLLRGRHRAILPVLVIGAVVAAAVALPAPVASAAPADACPTSTAGPTTSPTAGPAAGADLPYLVGAADADITPNGVINIGGFGLGDGTVLPNEAVGRGSTGGPEGERIKVRALVVDDRTTAVAIASIETQGYFASYADGPFGLDEIMARVAEQVPRLKVENQIVAADHTHSGPDTIGAWGGVSPEYFASIRDQAVTAIVDAYNARRPATLVAGHSDAADLIYNQSCPEALNQSEEPTYNGPNVCPTEGKDVPFRVLQARGVDGKPFVTYMTYAAHATAGGGQGVHGDWPQFLSEAMAERYGGVGIAMSGANGRTQPCRPRCSFTDPNQKGYEIEDRRAAYTQMYMNHVEDSVTTATPVSGPVRGAKGFIREVITGPAVLALFEGGSQIGAKLLRDREPPYLSGSVVGTRTSALRIGGVLVTGTPGEPFPEIAKGIAAAVEGEQEHFTLALAGDQLGYLISPAASYPIIAAEIAINDNAIFNVSATIGDHVMCSDIGLSLSLGFEGTSPPMCALYDAADVAGEAFGGLGVPGLPGG